MLDNCFIVILSGPPRSGKDTAMKDMYYNPITELVDWEPARFSMPLKRSVTAWLGQDLDKFGIAPVEAYKEAPIQVLNGQSYRQAQIDLFHHLAMSYGDDILGKLLVRDIFARESRKKNSRPTVYLVPDGGRGYEYVPLVKSFSKDKLLHLRIHREGSNYEGDIRSRIDAAELMEQHDIQNEDINKYLLDVRRPVADMLKRHGLLRKAGNIR